MTQVKQSNTRLSLNVRKMKFMQRGMGEEERRELQASEKIVTNEHWELEIPSLGERKIGFEILESFLYCRPCLHGRMSFGGFNKQIEKLMMELNGVKAKEEIYTEDADISDNEMAEHYVSLAGTVANRFKKTNKASKRTSTGDDDLKAIPLKLKRTSTIDGKGFMKPL